jgi:hypothetical protein
MTAPRMIATRLPTFGEAMLRTDRDRNVSFDELKAVELDRDLVAPPEAVSLFESHAAFESTASSGDALRLPQLTRLNGVEMRAAVSRVLAAHGSAPARDGDAQEKERKMVRLLQGVESAFAHIQSRSPMRA